ncbi:MAG: hypothetical protein AB8G11_02385 [Saprospiraceae bacterium]
MNGNGYIEKENLTEEEIRKKANYLYHRLGTSNASNYKKHRRIASGKIIQEDFEYITRPIEKEIEENGELKTIKLELPAKMYHLPICEPGIRVLMSDLSDRNDAMVFSANSISTNAYDKKANAFLDAYNLGLETQLNNRITAFQQQQQLLQLQQQAIQSGEVKMAEEVIAQLKTVESVINRQISFSSEELENIEKFYKYKFKDLTEIDTEHIINWHIESQDLKIKLERGFKESLINGSHAELYHVSVNEASKKIEYKVIYPENLRYPLIEDYIYLHELPYISEAFHLSKEDAVKFFEDRGQNISHITELGITGSGGNADAYVDVNGRFEKWNHESFNNNSPSEDVVTVNKMLFKVNTKKKGAIIQDLYIAYFINDKYVFGHKEEFPLRDIEEKGKVLIPYVGFVNQIKYGGDGLIEKTSDIQEAVNILFFKKMLLIITSGIKGMVYDISQMPTGMDMKEIMYYISNGIAPIQSIDKHGNPKNTAFNQFGNYDMGLSGSIQIIDSSIEFLKILASELTGVNAIRQGTLKPTDQVGSVQLAFNQSSAASEYYFKHHEKLVELMLTFGANLGNYIYYDDGVTFSYRNKDIIERIRIPKKRYKSDCYLYINSGKKDAQNLRIIKEAMQMRTQQSPEVDELTAFAKIIRTTSINDAEQILFDYTELASKKRQAAQEQNQQMMQQLKQQEVELEGRLKQMESQAKAELEQIKSIAAREIANIQSATKKYEVDNKVAIEKEKMQHSFAETKYKADSERAIESAFLKKETNDTQIEAKLNMMSMFIEDANRKIELKQRSKEKIKD